MHHIGCCHATEPFRRATRSCAHQRGYFVGGHGPVPAGGITCLGHALLGKGVLRRADLSDRAEPGAHLLSCVCPQSPPWSACCWTPIRPAIACIQSSSAQDVPRASAGRGE
eukprot:2268882-Pleurochrysis_carterae.AAC.2